MADRRTGYGKAAGTRSESQCSLLVKSLAASVGAIAISKLPGAKSKAAQVEKM
jgi:hypothetical protein